MPKYKHDTDNHRFLGTVDEKDVYEYYPFRDTPGLLIRKGNEPWNYASVPMGYVEESNILGEGAFVGKEYENLFQMWIRKTEAEEQTFVFEVKKVYPPPSDPTKDYRTHRAVFNAYTRRGAQAKAKKKYEPIRTGNDVFYVYELVEDE